MKKSKKIFPVLMLVLALVTSFAFRPTSKDKAVTFTQRVFLYQGGGFFNPANYLEVPIGSFNPSIDCPDDPFLCAIVVDESLVYTGEESEEFEGLPKVDINDETTHELGTGISDATNTTSPIDGHTDSNMTSLWTIYLSETDLD